MNVSKKSRLGLKRGVKKPGGSALRLLAVVKNNGIQSNS
jgi:DNA-binding transcriptional regulator YiaG